MLPLIASLAALQPHLHATAPHMPTLSAALLPMTPPPWAVSGGIGFAAGASGAFVVYPARGRANVALDARRGRVASRNHPSTRIDRRSTT